MKRLIGIAVAVIALSTMAVAAQKPTPRVIDISAKKFEFIPKKITLERGEPVTLRVRSLDRAHGLFQRELHLALDLTPDQVAEATLIPDKPGHYVVICDHFCGSGHGNMKMEIDVE